MGVEIRELNEVDQLRELAELFAVVWGRRGEPPIDSDILKALALSGNYVSGAYLDGRLIGGLVGWLGTGSGHELYMHSHILGVLPGNEKHGLGFDLKQHQRRWCLARDVKVMEWTTDPLVRRNGYFNLTKLGANAPQYMINVYGSMQDGINAGEESDRLLIRWQLDSQEAEVAAGGRRSEIDAQKLEQWGSAAILSVGRRDEPLMKTSSSRVLLCQVPEDIVAIRRSNPTLAREWRMAVREALGGSMKSGYRIKGATRSGWYVLESSGQ